ncbi:phosphoglycerol transferase MdoB-like AlkP superfamily enzyme [Lysinibacillus composti]|uniref:LTA synthase family protein n=1 Tax=Lysinibacillus composti TaxID=720633 RepID=A0A3N9UWQ6_9BACI|nr:LTA synthase family protein [Lysinibacillus composti]MBM7607112.1 phosphoglycerol transferase MdoB-like AlkP superfamily enzyme [Lysinibacillus composti]RQW76296.1 LTA synthase family protein [Lysinibacillus composti]
MKSVKWPKHSILALAIIATWIKTAIVYHTSFDMKIENPMQELILLINPLSFLLFIYGLSLFLKTSKARNRYIITVSTLLSIVLFANVGFYRFYNDFITLPVLFQTSNFGELGTSISEIINWTDILYFVDIILLLVVMKFMPKYEGKMEVRKQVRRAYFVLSLAVLFLNLGLAESERPQLLTRSFDRELLVKNIGTYNYHLYDIYIQSKSSAQRALADGSELVEVDNYVQANQAAVNEEMFGKYAGRNIILVQLESLQNFVINNEMNGEVVTPFLNSLTSDKDTYYFSDFYHQTGLGKTSDAEFLVENSLFGLGRGAVFFTHGGNTYNSMAESLGNNGYFSNVMHSNNKSFWNRDMIYKSLNIDKFYDLDSYQVTDENSVNWGLKDIPFFEQSVDLMTEMPQPFYSRMITLTNHYPFYLDEEDIMIPEYNSNSGTLNRYFQTVRYLDESIKVFFDELKEKGLYDNSIIVMYGDHYGISENHNKAMSMYLNKEEITPYDSALLQSVPLFIHVPGSGDGEVIDKTAGQIDLRPTILHLLGIDTSNDMQLGADLFSEEHEDFVIFRDGRFITDQYVYASEVCYDRDTGEEIGIEACQPYIERASVELEYSDKIINGDLLRFYDEETGNLKHESLE